MADELDIETDCLSGSVILNVENPQALLNYTWLDAPGGTSLGAGAMVMIPLAPGETQQVYLQTTNGSCTTLQGPETVSLPLVPTPSFSYDDVCAGDTVVLQADATEPNTTLNWLDAEGNIIGTGQQLELPLAAAQTVGLQAAQAGCQSDVYSEVVTPLGSPVADFQVDSTYGIK